MPRCSDGALPTLGESTEPMAGTPEKQLPGSVPAASMAPVEGTGRETARWHALPLAGAAVDGAAWLAQIGLSAAEVAGAGAAVAPNAPPSHESNPVWPLSAGFLRFAMSALSAASVSLERACDASSLARSTLRSRMAAGVPRSARGVPGRLTS